MPMWFVATVLATYSRGGDDIIRILNPLTRVVSEVRRAPWVIVYDDLEDAAEHCLKDIEIARKSWN